MRDFADALADGLSLAVFLSAVIFIAMGVN